MAGKGRGRGKSVKAEATVWEEEAAGMCVDDDVVVSVDDVVASCEDLVFLVDDVAGLVDGGVSLKKSLVTCAERCAFLLLVRPIATVRMVNG